MKPLDWTLTMMFGLPGAVLLLAFFGGMIERIGEMP